MPIEDDDITELNSSQIVNSQDSLLLPSSPEVSTTKNKKAASNTNNVTPQRSKRVRGEEGSSPRTCHSSVSNEDKSKNLNKDDILIPDVDIQQEKDFVKLSKRKTKK
jgi:hypothetical protein